MRRIGIVGPTHGVNTLLVVDWVRRLPADTIIVAGGARGVQETAVWTAEKRGLQAEFHRPQWGQAVDGAVPDKWVALDRATDELIAGCDELHAFIKWGERVNSVLGAIVRAKRAGKQITVHYDAPGGSAEVLVPNLPSPLRRSLERFLFTWEARPAQAKQSTRVVLSKPEFETLLDNEAQKRLGMSGAEFRERHAAGTLPDSLAAHNVAELLMLDAEVSGA